METRIIKADKKAAFKLYSPIFLLMMLYGIFGLAILQTNDSGCQKIFGLNASFTSLIVVAYLLPVSFFFGTVWLSYVGYKIIKYKYFPPLDIPVFKQTASNTGGKAKIMGIFYLSTPVIGLCLIYFGHSAYIKVTKGRTLIEAHTVIENLCANKKVVQELPGLLNK